MIILSAFIQVFRKIRYIVLASGVGIVVFMLSTWLPNLSLISQIITSQTASIGDKFSILISLLTSITTNFTLLSASYTIAIAILFGINTAMVIYYMNHKKKQMEQGGVIAGAGGLISGIFGIGCAACGTLVLGPLLALIGVGGIITILPFGGQEFGIFGVGFLVLSVFFTSKKIQDPLVCAIK